VIYTVIFAVFGVILVAASILAVENMNIVHSAVWLMVFLFAMGAFFIFFGATFLGSVELLVYVGAVVTLITFTLMLTGGKEFE
jgi:NADH-quinone oxidoreductase subunit J